MRGRFYRIAFSLINFAIFLSFIEKSLSLLPDSSLSSSVQMSRLNNLQRLLRSSIDASPEDMARYFKVQPGAYGEHDRFLGITMPTLRKIAKDNQDLAQPELSILLKSPYNEERCLALVIMADVYNKRSISFDEKDRICEFYLSNTISVNNWNLVDNSAHKILGEQLVRTSGPSDLSLLLKLAASDNMWERRISMVSTLAFIRRQQFNPTITIAKCLLQDDHDLIHKATGWMLREMGKKDIQPLHAFLTQHAATMPRTMLSYAMEKLSPSERSHYRSLKNSNNNVQETLNTSDESTISSRRKRNLEPSTTVDLKAGTQCETRQSKRLKKE